MRDDLHSSLLEQYLGLTELRRGDSDRARLWFEKALAKIPGESFALAQLAALSREKTYRDRLLRYYGSVEADWLMGRALLEQGKAPEASACLKRIETGLPDFRRGSIYLAAALGGTGDVKQGAQQSLRAIDNRPAPVMLEEPILALFSQLATEYADDYLAHYRHGLVLSQFGFFRESLSALDRAFSMQPSDDVVRERDEVRQYLTLRPAAQRALIRRITGI